MLMSGKYCDMTGLEVLVCRGVWIGGRSQVRLL